MPSTPLDPAGHGTETAEHRAREAGQKYWLDRSDSIEIAVAGETEPSITLYRAVLLRDIPARTPKGFERDDVPQGTIRAGSRGAFVATDVAISHDGDAWAGPDARIFAGGRVLENAQVWGSSEITGTVRDNAWVYGSRMDLYSSAAGKTVLVGSILDSTLLKDTLATGTTLTHSYAEAAFLDDTEAGWTSIRDSEVRGSVLAPKHPITLRDSQDFLPVIQIGSSSLLAVEIHGQRKGSSNSSIFDSRLTRVAAVDPHIFDMEIDGERVGRTIRLDDRITPRLARAWTRSLTPGIGSTATTAPLDMIDPAARVSAGDYGADWIRHYAVLALQARDRAITRYIDTLAADDHDYGVIETALAYPDLRRGMAEAFAAMPGLVVAGRFQQEDPATLLRSMISEQRRTMESGPLDRFPATAFPGIRRLHQVLGDREEGLQIGDETVAVLPILLRHFPMSDENAGDPLYEAAFVPVSSIRRDEPSALRFVTVIGVPSAFDRPEAAADFARALLAAETRNRLPGNGQALPNPRAPILTRVRLLDPQAERDPYPIAGADNGPPDWWRALSRSEQENMLYATRITEPLFSEPPADKDMLSPDHMQAVRDTFLRLGAGKMPQMVFEFQAATMPQARSASALGFTFHDGFQTAIVPAFKHPKDRTPLIHPDALDGALPTPTAALRVAERRVEVNRSWGWEQAPRYLVADLAMERMMARPANEQVRQGRPAPGP